MTPKRLIKRAFKSEYPVSRALAILEAEFRHIPGMEEMIDAVYEVYLRHTHPRWKGSYGEFIRRIERRKE